MQYTHQPAALWSELRAGNRDALGQLYTDYSPELHKFGLQVCRDPDMVSDCIHELFSRLWTQHERIGEAQNVRIYLYRSLERILVAQLLRNKKHVAPIRETDNKADSSEQLWIDNEDHKERLKEVKRCLQSLPKCQREVILLKFFNDLSYSEISEVMQMQVASVYNLTSKAIEQLRQKMHLPAA